MEIYTVNFCSPASGILSVCIIFVKQLLTQTTPPIFLVRHANSKTEGRKTKMFPREPSQEQKL